jgi:hypothetical protein
MWLIVACLGYGALLVFIGTLAQVEQGLYQAQARYFKSFFVYWVPAGVDWKIPILPAGYFLGTVMLLSLAASLVKTFEFSRQKLGLHLVHGGLILLLVGQLLTDLLARESSMRLVEGEARNYSESFSHSELVLTDTSAAGQDAVISIPETRLASGRDLPLPGVPLTLRVQQHWPNSELSNEPAAGAQPSGATHGVGPGVFVAGKPRATRTDQRDVPSAVVEVLAGQQSLGAWLVSPFLGRTQGFTHAGRTYELALRFTRHYKPFSIQLLDFRHDKYQGTEIPKNFSSRVRLQNAATGEDREVLIYMNNPLRYQGETFYQGSYDPSDDRVSILQVVENPGWLTPYVACVLVGAGLTWQFLLHLVGFLRRRIA